MWPIKAGLARFAIQTNSHVIDDTKWTSATGTEPRTIHIKNGLSDCYETAYDKSGHRLIQHYNGFKRHLYYNGLRVHDQNGPTIVTNQEYYIQPRSSMVTLRWLTVSGCTFSKITVVVVNQLRCWVSNSQLTCVVFHTLWSLQTRASLSVASLSDCTYFLQPVAS